MVTPSGLQGCSDEKLRRNKVVTIHGAAASLAQVLVDEWQHTTHEQAYEKLGQPDVHITNPSDKDVQLLQLQKLNQLVSRIIQRSRANLAKPAIRVTSMVTSEEEKKEIDELKGLFSQRGSPSIKTGPSAEVNVSEIAASTPIEEVNDIAGLAELLDGLKVSDKLTAARSWFAEQGIDTLAELKEADMVSDLADAIQLKPAKKKLLVKRVREEFYGR